MRETLVLSGNYRREVNQRTYLLEKSKTLPFEEWSQALKEGKASIVKQEVSQLNLAKVPRNEIAELAALAHRLNLPQLVLRLLNPVVRSESLSARPPSAEELAQYALALNRIGATDEAVGVLQSVETQNLEKIWLYRAFVEMTQWNYTKAASSLRKYIKSTTKDSQGWLVGSVNLAACLVFLQESEKAKNLLRQIIRYTQEHKIQVLYGNANELLAQVHLQKSEFDMAANCLEVAEGALVGTHGLGSFFVEKWQKILGAKKSTCPVESVGILSELRRRAFDINHWETVRDCDYAQAEVLEDLSLAEKLYFGTPFKEYRKRLKNRFDLNYSWRQQAKYAPGKIGEGSICLDVLSAQADNDSFQVVPGGVLHSLLFHMTKDFYRPMNLGTIFARLYPEEYFDPNTSFDRAFKSVQRLRAKFKDAGFAVSIEESRGAYWLKGEDIEFIVNLKEQLPSRERLELVAISKQLPDRLLKLSEVAEISGHSESKLRSIFSHPDNKDKVARRGKGPGTRYKIAS